MAFEVFLKILEMELPCFCVKVLVSKFRNFCIAAFSVLFLQRGRKGSVRQADKNENENPQNLIENLKFFSNSFKAFFAIISLVQFLLIHLLRNGGRKFFQNLYNLREFLQVWPFCRTICRRTISKVWPFWTTMAIGY